MASLVEECGTDKHYPLAMFQNGIPKNTRPPYKGTMNNGNPLSSSDSEMASIVKKVAVPRLKKINLHCYYLKINNDALFNNRSIIPTSLLNPLKSMLNF